VTNEFAHVHWFEGMFLQPHHFQAMERSAALEYRCQERLRPFWWGVADLAVNQSALDRSSIKIDRAALRFPGGIWVDVPGNAEVPEVPFGESLSADNPLTVWLALPRKESHRPVARPLSGGEPGAERPMTVREISVEDENTGDDARTLQVRLWNLKVFTGARPPDSYESMAVGRVVLSRRMDRRVMDPAFYPPMLCIGASSGLKEELFDIAVDLNNFAANLRRSAAERRVWQSQEIERIVTGMARLQVSAGAGYVLSQMLRVGETHPYEVYLELARLAGHLCALSPKVALDVPEYDHDNLTEVMRRLIGTAKRLINPGDMPDYYPSRRFEITGDQRRVRLDKEWIESELEMYICIDTQSQELSEQQVDQILADFRVKIGPPSAIKWLMESRVRGIPLSRLQRIPDGLQDRRGLHYFKPDLFRSEDLLNGIRRDLSLEIRGISENVIPINLLYVRKAQTGGKDDK
jgi:type VI secretion system protein ImpJ